MTKEDIIRMAREALRLPEPQTPQEEAIERAIAPIFERFAALVAQHEREACAKVCERMQEEIDELRQTLKRERVWVEKRHAAWHEGYEAGRKAERAFCAAVCDEKEEAFKNYYVKGLPALCAEAIRARSKQCG